MPRGKPIIEITFDVNPYYEFKISVKEAQSGLSKLITSQYKIITYSTPENKNILKNAKKHEKEDKVIFENRYKILSELDDDECTNQISIVEYGFNSNYVDYEVENQFDNVEFT